MEIWRKRTVSTDFWVIRAFPQNFHIRKLGENLVFSLSQVQYKSTEKQALSNKKRYPEIKLDFMINTGEKFII